MVNTWTDKQFEEFLTTSGWAEEVKELHRENFRGYIEITDNAIYYPTKEEVKDRQNDITQLEDILKELGILVLKDHSKIANGIVRMYNTNKDVLLHIKILMDTFKLISENN